MNKSKKINLSYYNLNMLYFIHFTSFPYTSIGGFCSDKAAISIKMDFTTILPLFSTYTTQAQSTMIGGNFGSNGRGSLLGWDRPGLQDDVVV